jgi:RNA polymerase sigma factor (sigma-70 family)
MTKKTPTPILQDLRQSLLRQDGADLTDSELLEGFISRRDEAAFEALVRRHGPMVLGVCRRILRNEADAADAFQAAFLVLVRKAATIRPRGMVGNWLYGVAHNTALKTKAMSNKRRIREREAAARPRPETAEVDQELLALLDQELRGLPDKYRAPLVLCELGGKSLKEAARELGCPAATVGTRLARGRRLLAGRLTRHGVTLGAGALAAVLARETAAAGVPPPLVVSTVKAASHIAAGQAATCVVGARVAALTEGVVRTMLLKKLRVVTLMILALTLLAAGVGLGLQQALAVWPAGPQGTGTAKQTKPPEGGQPAAKPDAPIAPRDKALAALEKSYRLADGEDLKCMRPPFPAERQAFVQSPDVPRSLARDARLHFYWNNGRLRFWGATVGGRPSALDVLTQLARIYPEELEGDRDLLKVPLDADFIARDGAPPAAIVAGMEKLLRKDFQLPAQLHFQQVERKVYVASGKYKFTPVPGRPADRIELYGKNLSANPGIGGGGSGTFAEFLQWTGRFTGKRVLAGKIENLPKARISWHDNGPDVPFTDEQWQEAHNPEGVFKHLTEQTGLTFREETRRVRILLVERKE